MKTKKLALVVVLTGLCLGGFGYTPALLGQGDAAAPTTEAENSAGSGLPPTVSGTASLQEMVDFRNYLMFGFSIVFALVIGFLVITHRRGGKLAEEAEFLRRRLDELHKK